MNDWRMLMRNAGTRSDVGLVGWQWQWQWQPPLAGPRLRRGWCELPWREQTGVMGILTRTT